MIIQVAHDFICPWCWVGLMQANRLRVEFGVEIEWLGYELFPIDLPPSDYGKPAEPVPNKPDTPTRFQFLLMCEGLELPKSTRPSERQTENAHIAIEYAKTEGTQNALMDALYVAYWHRGAEINRPEVISKIAQGIVRDVEALNHAVASRQYSDKVIKYDEPAYATGVFNVPTFFINGERYAEQPYSVLQQAVRAALKS